jgi:hypothetical protein
VAIYEIWADESWTHGGAKPNRYWCFFGGVMGPQPDIERLDTELAKIFAMYKLQGEVGWAGLRAKNLPAYRALVDCFVDLLRRTDLHFRQIFLDRCLVRLNPMGVVAPIADLDVQYLIYYQFLKHAFGLRYLPIAPNGERHRILIRLDDHSSQQHKDKLEEFVVKLASTLSRRDLDFSVKFLSSEHARRLQICDLMIGAAGSHGNKMHLRRDPDQRGMKPRQKVRHEMATYIYNKLRDLDKAERGTGAFNWFETTGRDGSYDTMLTHKLRIWKFKPARYHIDKGWQNDHLDKQGCYQGPDIVIPPPAWDPPDETF